MSAVPPQPATPTYQPLVVALLAAIAGIIADRYLAVGIWVWLTLAAVAMLRWFAIRRHVPARLSAIALLLAVLCVSGAWHHRWWFLFAENDLGRYAAVEPRPAVIEGTAQSGVRRMPAPPRDPLRAMEVGDRTRLHLQVTAIRHGAQWQPASGKTVVFVNGHLFDVLAGDRVRVRGMLAAPSPAQNPGEFDFADFCRGNRELSLIRCDSPQAVELVQRGTAWNPRRWIDRVRTAGENTLWRFISTENAGLAAAMFLGLRDELDPDQMDAFKETGTVHLLVISGLNVGILAACVLFALKTGWLSNRAALALLCVVTVLYALVTDAQPPVVRATVLVLAFCFAQLLGRRGMAFNTLAAAALVVLLLNPVELFRPGTQLSFLAVGALIAVGQSWLTGPMSNTHTMMLEALPARMQLYYLLLRFFSQIAIVSFVVWCAVQPLVAARFNLVTPSAIFLGPLLSIPVAVAMAAGFGVMTLGAMVPPLGLVCGFICDRALAIVVHAVEATRNAPGGKFWTAGPSDWWLGGFYGVLIAWAVFPPVRRIRGRWFVVTAVIWFSLGFAEPSLLRLGRNHLQVTFLAVGHGLAVVMETPDGQCVVYDAGSMASPEVASRAISGYLFSRHIRRLDLLIISHADTDHYNAIPQLLHQFNVRQVCYTDRMFRDRTEPLIILHDALAEASLQVRTVVARDVLFRGGEAEITVLYPFSADVPGSDNAASIVAQVSYAGRTLLLSGDLESPGIERVMQLKRDPVDLLLAPHHGSLRSDPPGFASWARPQHVVISGALRDRSQLVRAAYERHGASVYHTADCGAVSAVLTAAGCQVKTFLP